MGAHGVLLPGAGGGEVVVGVKGLLVEVHVQLGLLALDNDAQVVGGDAGDALLGFDQLDGLADLLELALGEQGLGGVAGDVDARGALINRLLDLGVAAVGVEADLGNPLHLAAALPVVEEVRVLLHDPGVDGGDAVGLGQFERLADLGVGVVAPHEGGDVAEVARVRPAADEVAAHHEAAELLTAHLAHRHRSRGTAAGAPAGAGVSAAELVWPRRPSGTAAEAIREDFTKPRREICRAMRWLLPVPMGNVNDGAWACGRRNC